MKISFDLKKSGEAVAGALGKATEKAADLGAKVATEVQVGARDLAEKTKRESYQRRLKKYNPLFPEQYQAEGFHVPNMVMIVDDAVRRGIDVCEGAIGWRGEQNGVEILYLYDEAVEWSGLKFIPAAICDSVYYIDKYDRTRFIQVDSIFSAAHNERMAELQHIAFSLGAKRCTIEIVEEDVQSSGASQRTHTGGSATLKAGKASARSCEEAASQASSSIFQSGVIEAVFSGARESVRPQLKWFRNDDVICNLVEMCCSGGGLEKQSLILEGAASATLSKTAAKAIDGAVGKLVSVKGEMSMEMRANKEHRSKLIFCVEF